MLEHPVKEREKENPMEGFSVLSFSSQGKKDTVRKY